MVEQFGAYSPATPDGTADATSADAFTAHGVSPAEISQPQQGSAMDGELAAIRHKIKRLEGTRAADADNRDRAAHRRRQRGNCFVGQVSGTVY